MVLWQVRSPVLYKLDMSVDLATLFGRPIRHVFAYNADAPEVIIDQRTGETRYNRAPKSEAYVYDVATGRVTVYHPSL